MSPYRERATRHLVNVFFGSAEDYFCLVDFWLNFIAQRAKTVLEPGLVIELLGLVTDSERKLLRSLSVTQPIRLEPSLLRTLPRHAT